MDALYAPLSALESLASGPPPAKKSAPAAKPIARQLDDLALAFSPAGVGSSPPPSAATLALALAQAKDGIDDAIKSYHKAITRLGTSLDKTVYHPPPALAPPRFQTAAAQAQLDGAVQATLVRLGQRSALDAFERETGRAYDRALLERVEDVERVIGGLRVGDLTGALDWVDRHAGALPADSPLPFALHRSAYLSLLVPPSSASSAGHPPPQVAALAYARTHFPPFYGSHKADVHRLLAALLFPPSSSSQGDAQGLAASPYADLAGDWHRKCLEPLVRRAWAELEGLAERDVLARAVAAGADGGVARVEKALAVLAGGGVGSTGEGELPIEIPLEPADRHHSIFVCPVSKELASPSTAFLPTRPPPATATAAGTLSAGFAPQVHLPSASPSGRLAYDPASFPPYYLSHGSAPGTGDRHQPQQPHPQQQQQQQQAPNPAVMLKCGHTVVRESLKRLNKGSARGAAAAAAGGSGARGVKCAYCPVETPAGKELELHF